MDISLNILLVILSVTVTTIAKDVQKYVVTEEVWFDIEVYDGVHTNTGRVVIAVFGDTCPMTALNFVTLARGYKRPNKPILHYKNTPVHRIVQDFVVQMGDVTVKDGTGGESIYGKTFADESFDISHKAVGMVSMANHGQDTNGSQFFILLSKARWLDGSHVAFGKVIKGMDILREMSDTKSVLYKHPLIVDCGVVGLETKYTMTEKQVMMEEDL